MKRIVIGCVLILVTALFTGCTGMIDLTDSENRAIAQYAADLLLKYAAGYEYKYYDGEVAQDTLTTEEMIEPTTEELTESATQELGPQQPDSMTTQEQTTQTVQEPAAYVSDVAEILGLDKLSITYRKYQITDRYPYQNEAGETIYLEATKGMKLIVTEFDVHNLTAEECEVDLLSMDAEYRIVMNQSKTAKSMLTILMDDLSTYEATLAAEATEKAVLVFQIADGIVDQIQTLDMKVIYGTQEGMIKLQG